MAVYEYQCTAHDCAHVFIEIMKMLESDKLVFCPKCGTKAVKLVSQSSFVLKGPGWAKDGYR
jgi:putative FmdB family regulatory protein